MNTQDINDRKISTAIKSKIQLQLHQNKPAMRAYSLNLTGNMPDANDLYQSTALRIISNAEKFKQGTNFKAWAMTIMRNIFINNYRRKIRQREVNDPTSNNYFLNSGSSTIKNNGETNLAYKELLKMVSALPTNIKRPFWMAYKGFKYDEIAEELDAPIGTIKSRIFFARQKLQKMYEQVA